MSTNLKVVNETTGIILIKDSLKFGGIGILKTFLNSLCCRVTKVFVILYEVQPKAFKAGLSPDILQNLEIIDIRSDILGWNGSANTISVDKDLIQHLQEMSPARPEEKIAVVIDSLSSLILSRTPAYTCQVLHKLGHRENAIGSEVCQVITIVHEDMHEDETLALLEHTATSVLTVLPPKSPDFTMSCRLLHKKNTGKIIRVHEEYKLTASYEIIKSQEIQILSEVIAIPSVDPTVNLTFNLNLRDSEKEARSQVQLPYLYDKNRQEDVLKKSVGEGKIFYQPDEADDFDEEDPDDDLDI